MTFEVILTKLPPLSLKTIGNLENPNQFVLLNLANSSFYLPEDKILKFIQEWEKVIEN